MKTPVALIPRSSRAATGKRRALPWSNLLYVLPALLIVAVAFYYAIGYTAYVSTLEWNGLSAQKTFVGFENYLEIARDPIFHRVLGNTALFALLTISVQMLLGLLLAVLLRFKVALRGLYKVIFFLPVVTAPAVTAYVFRQIFAFDGPLNRGLELIGLGALKTAWLAEPRTALYALIAINIWQWTGFSFILYSAALTVIDEAVYDAAKIDGASFGQTFRHITFPMLGATHLTLIILGAIGALKTFDLVYLTTGGGPGRVTELLSTYIFKKGLLEFNAGYAAALSVVLLLIALAFTAMQLRASTPPERPS